MCASCWSQICAAILSVLEEEKTGISQQKSPLSGRSWTASGGACEYNGWDTSLPILLISGQEDPVGDGGKGVQAICSRMMKSGMENVTIKLFPGARHDLLHEEKNGAEAARKWIAAWIKL